MPSVRREFPPAGTRWARKSSTSARIRSCASRASRIFRAPRRAASGEGETRGRRVLTSAFSSGRAQRWLFAQFQPGRVAPYGFEPVVLPQLRREDVDHAVGVVQKDPLARLAAFTADLADAELL